MFVCLICSLVTKTKLEYVAIYCYILYIKNYLCNDMFQTKCIDFLKLKLYIFTLHSLGNVFIYICLENYHTQRSDQM